MTWGASGIILGTFGPMRSAFRAAQAVLGMTWDAFGIASVRLCDDFGRLRCDLGRLWDDLRSFFIDLGLLSDDLGCLMEPQASSDTVTGASCGSDTVTRASCGARNQVSPSPNAVAVAFVVAWGVFSILGRL
jgi:hypothetical protein